MIDDPSRKKGVVDKNIAPTIRSETHGNLPCVASQSRIRRLTPIETEKLQGFKSGWTSKGIDENGKEIKISDSSRYRMCGNAVTVDIVELIGRKLLA